MTTTVTISPYVAAAMWFRTRIGRSDTRDLAAGCGLRDVAVVVGEGVVALAQEPAVGDGGVAAVAPRFVVVGVAHRGGSFAAEGGATTVPESHGYSLGFGVEAASPADVEGFGCSAEDDRDDPCLTGQAAGLAGGDPGAVAQTGSREVTEE